VLLPVYRATSSNYRPLSDDIIDRSRRRSTALGRVGLGEVFMVFLLRTVERLLKNGLGLVDLKLCLEIGNMRKAATVGAAASIGKGELLASDIIVDSSPVSSVSALWGKGEQG
jgi:hypothetical protein